MPVQRRAERPVPACQGRHRTGGRWVAKTYSVRLAQFYRPCRRPECYPDGDSPDAGERVVRVANGEQATAVHRPAERGTRDETEADAPAEPAPREPLSSVGELSVGDSVTWPTRETPLTVQATEWPLSFSVTLTGPSGGTYTLRERHSAFWVYPGYGRVDDVARLPADTPLSE